LTKIKTKKAVIILIAIAGLSGAPFCFVSAKNSKLSVSDVPEIYPRSSWSKSSYEKRTKNIWPAKYEDPKVIVVHHTAASYSGSTAKQVRKIYKYHSYTKKWGDIGYNYIIGKDGKIFEGRYGGNGAVGGHAYYNGTNYNEGSIGIAVIGNYDDEKLSAEAQDSLQKLVGWLAANNSITVNSDIKFHGKKLDNTVIGHRDIGSTDCPGKRIYDNLDAMRSKGAEFSEEFSNYAYSYEVGGTAYEIANGKRYSKSGRQPVVNISKNQILAYGSGGDAEVSVQQGLFDYPSGTLVKVSSEGKRGIIENGNLRTISGDSLLSSSYDSSSFVEITSEKWASFPSGSPAEFRNGAFVKDLGGNYFILSGNKKRRIILSDSDLKSIDRSSAHDISDGESARYAEGEIISSADSFPAGALLTGDYKNYFYVSEKGLKKKISKDVFRATFSRGMAIKVSQKFLKKYKTREVFPFQSGATVNYRSKYYFIENGARRQFATKSLAASMGYKNIIKAKRTEMAGVGEGKKIE
jgi:hypothetical protein